MSQMNDQPYRTGLIGEAGGIQYWHTGAQYWIAVGSADGEQVDLREFQGFKKIDNQFDRATAIFFDNEWNEIADADPTIAAARKILQDRAESLWWKLVADFLKAHHATIQHRAQAARILRDSGMEETTIKAVLIA